MLTSLILSQINHFSEDSSNCFVIEQEKQDIMTYLGEDSNLPPPPNGRPVCTGIIQLHIRIREQLHLGPVQGLGSAAVWVIEVNPIPVSSVDPSCTKSNIQQTKEQWYHPVEDKVQLFFQLEVNLV